MGFPSMGQLLGAALLGVSLLVLWEVQAAAVWRTEDVSEVLQHPVCAPNQTEEKALLADHLKRRRKSVKLRCPGSHGKGYKVCLADRSEHFQCVYPDKSGEQKASERVKQWPKVFANPKTEDALEGEDVILVCESSSYPPIEYWDWYRHNDVQGDVLLLNGTRQRVFITESGHRSELLLRSVDTFEDPTQYICMGTNGEGYHAAVVLLRVHGQVTELWPFLGIFFEVFLLLVIMVLNERSRTLAEELAEE